MDPFKPNVPRGTRDFSPTVLIKRNYILDTIRKVFEKYGFMPLETPAIENLSVLTGKYGEEGDKLLFKILNSGDYLAKIENIAEVMNNYTELTPRISEKGLRYDLTVPFARYVAMNRGEITFPFKRYQIQPVWRADRPQKGRYREFYQCDADVIGTDSLICEAEFIALVSEVFQGLGLNDYIIKINNRKILHGIAESAGNMARADEFYVILDKLDKIGVDKVKAELENRDFGDQFIHTVDRILQFSGGNREKLEFLSGQLNGSEKGMKGLNEVERLLNYCESLNIPPELIDFDFTLARGLSYYTGMIFETKATRVKIGSIGGGGRYDDLTGVFGLPDMPGVGFSFGIDRIYDVLEELDLFEEEIIPVTDILIANFDPEAEKQALNILSGLRSAGIHAEIYPEKAKLKKQLNYANKKNIPFVLMIGSEELKKGVCTLKNMTSGEQKELTPDEVIQQFSLGTKNNR